MTRENHLVIDLTPREASQLHDHARAQADRHYIPAIRKVWASIAMKTGAALDRAKRKAKP